MIFEGGTSSIRLDTLFDAINNVVSYARTIGTTYGGNSTTNSSIALGDSAAYKYLQANGKALSPYIHCIKGVSRVACPSFPSLSPSLPLSPLSLFPSLPLVSTFFLCVQRYTMVSEIANVSALPFHAMQARPSSRRP